MLKDQSLGVLYLIIQEIWIIESIFVLLVSNFLMNTLRNTLEIGTELLLTALAEHCSLDLPKFVTVLHDLVLEPF